MPTPRGSKIEPRNPDGINQFTGLGPYEIPPPPAYPPETRIEVIQRIANGETPQSIEKIEGMPCRRTIRYWLRHDEAFARCVADARRHAAQSLVDEALDSARDAKDKDSAAASRVKTDTFLRVAGMYDRDKFGLKQAGSGPSTIVINTNVGVGVQHSDSGAYVVRVQGEVSHDDGGES